MIAILLAAACLGPVEVTWTVDRPLGEVAECLQQHSMSAAAHLPPGLLTARGADEVGRLVPRIRIDYRPADHYLWTKADLTPWRLTGSTIMEVWGRDSQTVVRLTTRLEMPRNGCLGRLISRIAERVAIDYERDQLRQLTE